MTISSSDGPLVAVVGSTGSQGGSVIKALRESSQQYRIRAITRDPAKDAGKALAQQGAEVVKGDITQPESLKAAFEGAQIVFAVTDFWAHLSREQEVADGKRIVDAAAAAGVELFIYSGLTDLNKASNGKYARVDHFDGKADVLAYAQSRIGADKVVDVQAAFYLQNLATLFKPSPAGDGTFAFFLPISGSAKIAAFDVTEYGYWVRAAIEKRQQAGNEVLACGDVATYDQFASVISELSGKTVKVVTLPDKDWLAALPFPEHVRYELLDMLQAFEGIGYYGGKDPRKSAALLDKPASTWETFAKSVKWAEVLQ